MLKSFEVEFFILFLVIFMLGIVLVADFLFLEGSVTYGWSVGVDYVVNLLSNFS